MILLLMHYYLHKVSLSSEEQIIDIPLVIISESKIIKSTTPIASSIIIQNQGNSDSFIIFL